MTDSEKGVSVDHLNSGFLKTFEELGLDIAAVDIHKAEEQVIVPKTRDQICPQTGKKGVAYVQLLGAEDAALPSFLFSYTWCYKVKDIVECLVDYCTYKKLDPLRTFVWIDCLCINQHRVKETRDSGEKTAFQEFCGTIEKRVSSMDKVVAMMAPWEAPHYMGRVWCDFELFSAVECKKDVDIWMPPGERDRLQDAFLDGQGLKTVWKALTDLDIREAEASVPQDKIHIFDYIKSHHGFEKLNNKVSTFLMEWIAGTCGDVLLQQIQSGKLDNNKTAKLCSEVASFLAKLSQFEEATKMLSEGWKVCSKGSSFEAQLYAADGNIKSKQKQYVEAVECYKEADKIYEAIQDAEKDLFEQRSELFRKWGVALKHMSERPNDDKATEAKAKYDEAMRIREETKSLETIGGADLLRNIGAWMYDNEDKDGALDKYMEVLKVLSDLGQIRTPSGAYALANTAEVQESMGDIENAHEIYMEARRIRERTSTSESAPGRYLSERLAQAKRGLNATHLVDIVRIGLDDHGSGQIKTTTVMNLLSRTVPELKIEQIGELLQESGCQKGDMVEYARFFGYIYGYELVEDKTKSTSVRIRPVPSPQRTISTREQTQIPHTDSRRGIRCLSWNIMSPDYSPNSLEMLQGCDSLSLQSNRILRKLLIGARNAMLRPEKSQSIGDMLGDAPLRKAGELEKAPLTNEKMLKGVIKWLAPKERRELLPEYTDLEQAAKAWCADYKIRWNLWSRQRLCEFIKDDGSGGKMNPQVPPNQPCVDDVAWNYGISSADRALATHPVRLKRVNYMLPKSRLAEFKDTDKPLPAPGKFDFFKLLVWDMLLNHVVSSSIKEDELDNLLEELQPPSAEKRTQLVTQRVQEADITVLTEAPAKGLLENFENDFHIVRASSDTEHVKNYTVILARKEKFHEPVPEYFEAKAGTEETEDGINPRIVGCKLKCLDGGKEVHVIGVHFPPKHYDTEFTVPKIEERITSHTIIMGDFNLDLRRQRLKGVHQKETPKFCKLIEQAKQVPTDVGSCNKQRSPFQAQVSKMFIRDFSMKDYVLLGESFEPVDLEGTISRTRTLPDREMPSDHSPISFDLVFAK